MAAPSPGSPIQSAGCIVLLLACSAIQSVRPLQIWQRPYHQAASTEPVKVEGGSDPVATQGNEAENEAVAGQGITPGHARRDSRSGTTFAHRARLR
ncbi:MAG: hypothetical protein WCF10_19545 [Polyangiales bacterium]